LRCVDRAMPPVTLGASLGGAIFPIHGRSEPELLAAAERAMHAAGRAGEPYRLALAT